MTPLQRGLVGAAMGSLTVLAIHPGSRPFLFSGFGGWGPSRTLASSPLIYSNLTTLPQPTSPVEAGLWMDAIFVASKNGSASDTDYARALSCADLMASRDPDNAFWRQVAAVIHAKRGEMVEADRDWVQASKAAKWDNQAGARNSLVLDALEQADGGALAWHGAAVKRLEAMDTIRAIESFARESLRRKGITTNEDLLFRYATLENGRLMRDGAKSLATGQIGYGIVELSSYPQEVQAPSTPRKLILARTGMTSNLQQAGFGLEAERVAEAFRTNDGWKALMPLEDAGERFRQLGIWAMFTVSLPGAFFLVALVGANLWGVGELLKRPALKKIVKPSAAPALGLMVGLLVWQATRQVLAAISVAASIAFLAFTPPGTRNVEQVDMGKAFLKSILFLTAAFIVPAVLFVVYVNAPSWEVLTSISPAHTYNINTSSFAIPAIVALALALVSAPAWAYGLRVTTVGALGATFRTLGKQVFVACLTFAIALTPIAALLDRDNSENLRKLATNEPVYYYLQR